MPTKRRSPNPFGSDELHRKRASFKQEDLPDRSGEGGKCMCPLQVTEFDSLVKVCHSSTSFERPVSDTTSCRWYNEIRLCCH
jgi:hypothetical protein